MQLSWAQCAVQRFGPKTEHGAVLCCTEFWCAVVTLVVNDVRELQPSVLEFNQVYVICGLHTASMIFP